MNFEQQNMNDVFGPKKPLTFRKLRKTSRGSKPGRFNEINQSWLVVSNIFLFSQFDSYCWWKKSCTSWYVVYLIIFKVYVSQVVQDFFHQQYFQRDCFFQPPTRIWETTHRLWKNHHHCVGSLGVPGKPPCFHPMRSIWSEVKAMLVQILLQRSWQVTIPLEIHQPRWGRKNVQFSGWMDGN